MEKQVDYVSPDTSVKEVCHLIFERGINGVPVCKNNKVVGFITERDVLAKFFPTMQEYVEDPVHEADFEKMEEKVSYILSLTADKIMSKTPVVIDQNAPLLRAQSMMFVHKVGRLPVVDGKGNLVGIVSKGDIFKTIVGQKLALGDEESYFDWLANHYDYAMDWEKRLAAEIPALIRVFKKNKIKKVLDIACSTGEHSITLARNGFEVVGLDSSGRMIKISDAKKAKLPDVVRNKVHFLKDYKDSLSLFQEGFDAAIFMGNALPHVIITDQNILKETINILNLQKGILIFQIDNFEKAIKVNRGLREFVIKKFGIGIEHDHAFLTFYTKTKNKSLIHTKAIFDFNGENWRLRGINDTEIMYIDKQKIEAILRRFGFKEIEFYGSKFLSPLFKEPFSPLESDWLNVVARI